MNVGRVPRAPKPEVDPRGEAGTFHSTLLIPHVLPHRYQLRRREKVTFDFHLARRTFTIHVTDPEK